MYITVAGVDDKSTLWHKHHILLLVVLKHDRTTASLGQEPAVTRVAEGDSDRVAALGATVQSAARIEVHRDALLVFNTHLTARRGILVGGVLLLPQVHGVEAQTIADSADAGDEVGRGALGGLGGGGGCSGSVRGLRAVGCDGAGGCGGGPLEL